MFGYLKSVFYIFVLLGSVSLVQCAHGMSVECIHISTLTGCICDNITTSASFQSISTIKEIITCDFEDDIVELCYWNHYDLTDDFDWTRFSGATPTTNTGPAFDHTTGSTSGHYVYTESSAPRKLGERAALISPTINTLNSNYMCFTMWYHGYGVDLGNLSIIQQQTEYMNSTLTLWTSDKTSQDAWKEVKTSIIPTGPFKLIIQVSLGNGYRNDFAIDDLSISEGKCTSVSPPGPSLVG